MKHFYENTHVYYANLRGKTNQQLFETEIQKMKMLDITVKCRNTAGVQILSYCVLDNEFHLVLMAGNPTQMEEFLEQLKVKFEESCTESRPAGRTVFRKTQKREIEKESAVIRYCVRVHMFPVISGIVTAPEDYWWCSYRDYLGRKWLPLTNIFPVMAQIDADYKKAVQRMKQMHRRTAENNSGL